MKLKKKANFRGELQAVQGIFASFYWLNVMKV